MNAVPPPPNPARVVALRARIVTQHALPRPRNLRRHPGARRIGHALQSDMALNILFTEMPRSALARVDIEDMFNHALASIYAETGLRTYYQLQDRWHNRAATGRHHANWNVATRANAALTPAQLAMKRGVLNDLCAAANLMNIYIHPNETQLRGIPTQPANQVAGHANPGAGVPPFFPPVLPVVQLANVSVNAPAAINAAAAQPLVLPVVQPANANVNTLTAINAAAALHPAQPMDLDDAAAQHSADVEDAAVLPHAQPQTVDVDAQEQHQMSPQIGPFDEGNMPHTVNPANLQFGDNQSPISANLRQSSNETINHNIVAQAANDPDIEMEEACVLDPAVVGDSQMTAVEPQDHTGVLANHPVQLAAARDNQQMVDSFDNVVPRHGAVQPYVEADNTYSPDNDQDERLERVHVSLQSPPPQALFVNNIPQGTYRDHDLTMLQAMRVLHRMFLLLSPDEAERVLTEHAGDVGQTFRELDSQYERLTTWQYAVEQELKFWI